MIQIIQVAITLQEYEVQPSHHTFSLHNQKSDVGDAGVEEFDASSLEAFLFGDDGVVRLSPSATAVLLQFSSKF